MFFLDLEMIRKIFVYVMIFGRKVVMIIFNDFYLIFIFVDKLWV